MTEQCPHCAGKGTCATNKGEACDYCFEEAKRVFPFGKPRSINIRLGLPCATCAGTGKNYPSVMSRVIAPLLATLIVAAALVIGGMVVQSGDKYQGEVVTFLGTLAGSVTGFYFGGRGGDEPMRRRRSSGESGTGNTGNNGAKPAAPAGQPGN
jgi:hypothetical protein